MAIRDLADVLVIGAGASGAALTWRLSTAGIKVVCLEQGGWIEPETLPANESNWELRRLQKQRQSYFPPGTSGKVIRRETTA